MTEEQVLRAITMGGWYLALVSANVFVLAYSFLARWWRTEFGRHLFIFMLVIALIMNDSTIRFIFGDYHGRLYVSAVLFAGLGLVIAWRVFILFHVQWRKRRYAYWPEDSKEVSRHSDPGMASSGGTDPDAVA